MSPELSDKMRRTLNEIKAFEHSEEVRLHQQMAEQDTLTTGREQGELREKLDKALADLRYCQGQLEKAEVRLPVVWVLAECESPSAAFDCTRCHFIRA